MDNKSTQQIDIPITLEAYERLQTIVNALQKQGKEITTFSYLSDLILDYPLPDNGGRNGKENK